MKGEFQQLMPGMGIYCLLLGMLAPNSRDQQEKL